MASGSLVVVAAPTVFGADIAVAAVVWMTIAVDAAVVGAAVVG